MLMGRQLPRQSRKLLAEGLLLSRFTYQISQWGGASGNCLTVAQRLQNRVARWVNSSSSKTRISTLLTECGWLSIREMIQYHSLIQLWKIVRMHKPEHFEDYEIDDQDIISTTPPRLQFTREGFRWRTISDWNKLTPELRELKSLPVFKKKVKKDLDSTDESYLARLTHTHIC